MTLVSVSHMPFSYAVIGSLTRVPGSTFYKVLNHHVITSRLNSLSPCLSLFVSHMLLLSYQFPGLFLLYRPAWSILMLYFCLESHHCCWGWLIVDSLELPGTAMESILSRPWQWLWTPVATISFVLSSSWLNIWCLWHDVIYVRTVLNWEIMLMLTLISSCLDNCTWLYSIQLFWFLFCFMFF